MRDWKDRLGIFASAACAVHCAATPILVASLPTLKLTEWMADPRFHQIAAVVCCGLVAVAIIPAALRLRDLRLLSLASAGLGLILSAAFAMPESCCSTAASTLHAHQHEHSHSHAGHDHAHDDPTHAATEPETAQSPTLLMAGLGVAHPWMTPIGGLLLIAAHGLNMKRRWKASCEKAHCCGGTCTEEQVIKLPEHEFPEHEFPELGAGGSSTLARAS